jgi:putative transposase
MGAMSTARYRYRFYLSPEQERQLARTFGCVRFAYNWALRTRGEAFRERGERVDLAETDRRLTQLKRRAGTRFLSEVSSVPLKQALRHLDRA